ncbi:ABC transporter ATP-binding protein [Streptacidiphilus anmyonensis]|uniref:ABC transporter ATP-binding protein n=1 Tax=Streptacidiphilus anmyonensis TaxID=405782 RepID=UPI0005A8D7C7|nr:ATP-binding cassette domain-containing protein [Streptacidiphilus anmyonensis]
MQKTDAPALEARGLTRRYGGRAVVDDVSFQVMPGRVTGFLGPNGAGKSTTLRLLLGLERPDSGEALVLGRPYAELEAPLATVGALLEARSFHPGRSARNHLLALARASALPEARVEDVLARVGLSEVADRRAGGYSLGMGQRLGIAAALLGDPRVVVLDEPVNGLDPEGILWVRTLAKALAAEGRAVLISSHLMNEMALTADHLLVIGRGRLLADCSTAEFIRRHTDPATYAATPEVARPALLEEAFLRLTSDSVQYTAV